MVSVFLVVFVLVKKLIHLFKKKKKKKKKKNIYIYIYISIIFSVGTPRNWLSRQS